jgi:hypothetical protein
MPYYVPVGRRGYVMRFGMLMVRMFGSMEYWRAARRRA